MKIVLDLHWGRTCNQYSNDKNTHSEWAFTTPCKDGILRERDSLWQVLNCSSSTGDTFPCSFLDSFAGEALLKGTIDLLVPISLDQKLFILRLFFTLFIKQATLT
jgi:hypothetical protein